jgi:hypothetical protein
MCAKIPQKLYPAIKWRQLRPLLMDLFWAPWATRHLRQTLVRVKPDVIWIIAHQWSIPPIHAAISSFPRRWHVSIQDYVDILDNPWRFGQGRCRRMAAAADDLYARATSTDAICQEMADDLAVRTGRKTSTLLRYGIEPEELESIDSSFQNKPNDEIRIVYPGSVVVQDEFRLFVKAAGSLSPQLSKPIRLHLFGNTPYAQQSWFNPSWMVVHGNLPEAKLLEEMRQAHWSFSPMSLSDEQARYNRFSFPTKFITSLRAGLPVITLGHPESSVMKMASRYRVGHSTSTSDAGALAAELKTVLDKPADWHGYHAEIVRCARTEFDASRMRRRLYECLLG